MNVFGPAERPPFIPPTPELSSPAAPMAPDVPFAPPSHATETTDPTPVTPPSADFVRVSEVADVAEVDRPAPTPKSTATPLGAVAAEGAIGSSNGGDGAKPDEPERREKPTPPPVLPGTPGQPLPAAGEALEDQQARQRLEAWAREQGGDVASGGRPPVPPRPPRGPEENAQPDDEGRFLPPIPDETRRGIVRLRIDLRDLTAATPLSEAEIVEWLGRDSYLTAAYPNLSVPEGFKQARPNIRFTPPHIDEAGLAALGGGPEVTEQVMDYAHTSGLTLTNITTPEALAEHIVKIRNDLSGHVPDAHIAYLQDDAFGGYLSNLELHRLTEDPNGRAVRLTRTPAEDMPYSSMSPDRLGAAEQHSNIDFRFVNPSLRPMGSVGWLTSWFRQEPSPADLRGIQDRARVETTVGALEQTNQLAYDRSRSTSSLLAFRTIFR